MTPRMVATAKGVLKWIIILMITTLAAALVFPLAFGERTICRKSAEKSDVSNLVAASKAFYTEYGRYPLAESGGRFTTEESQGKLMRVLTGEDTVENPRRIVFFESKVAQERMFDGKNHYVSGFSPLTGALMDRWGNPYHVVVDADYDGQIPTPYVDDDRPPRTGVIAWSLGKDRRQSERLRGSDGLLSTDDVVSWN